MMRKLGVVLLWLCAMSSSASAAVPSIESVSPGVGQRDTAFEITITGAGLNDVAEVLLYRKGLECAGLTPGDDTLTVRLTASEECPLGAHPFRLRSPRGVSELRTVNITPFPVVTGTEPNETPDTAQAITGDVTIHGVAGADDVDCYRVALQAGDPLAAEVEAVRLGGPLIDTVLAVYGPEGTLLARSDDTPLFAQDPFVSLVAATTGEYIVEVAETNRDGDDQSQYALHLGRFPRPQAIYPAGGPAGTEVVVRNLRDARGDFEQVFTVPLEASGDLRFFPRRGDESAPTPHRFRVSTGPNLLETEPNDASVNNSSVQLPHAFNGIVQSPGDRDRFAFSAEAGATWRFELFSDRIGSTLDAVMSIESASGRLVARSDDWESHDGRLDVTFPDSGEYVLSVADKRESGDPLFVYRVEVDRVAPQLHAFLPRPDRLNQQWQTICIPRGNRVLACLGVQRENCAGDVELTVNGVPTGVSVSGGAIAADRFWTPVVFTATDDASLTGALAGVHATCQIDGSPLRGEFRQVVDLVGESADRLYHSVEVDLLAVAITEEAPVRVSLEPPANPLSQGGTSTLRIALERRAGFDDPVEIVLPFLPPWVDGPASVTIPPGETSADLVLNAWPEAAARTWVLCAEARPGRVENSAEGSEEPGMRRRRRSRASIAEFRVASELVELTIAPPPVTAAPTAVAGEQGAVVPLVYHIEPTGTLPAELTATLEGLPNRVSVEPVQITGADGAVKFVVHLDPTAPLGEFNGLQCRLSGQSNGQSISYVVGRDSTLSTAAPGELVLGTDGKPLSKLEVLRRNQSQTSPAAAEPASSAQ